ncbi:MAG: hypothetical protein ACFFG0_42820 [Candidatus Thorarchaeota archaeon]
MGIWESLYNNMDYFPHSTTNDWLIEVGDNKLNNSNYLYLTRNNTRFHSNKSGWYRVNIIMAADYLIDQERFDLWIYKNDVPFLKQFAYGHSIRYDQFVFSFYVSSNGTNYYEFNCWGTDFALYPDQTWNQLVIEYVGET